MGRLPPLRDRISALVAAPSVSSTDPALDSSNLAVVSLLAEWAEAAGMTAEVRAVPGRPGKHNVIARLGGPGPPGLVLAGHTDTVPFDERSWSSDPLRATERDGKLHGIGTADMKSFLAVALEVAVRVGSAKLAKPLVVIGTADEESTMSGARALLSAGEPLGARVVIGEPTGLCPVRAHKGILMERVRVTGRSGHSSDPRLGASALEGMHAVIARLLALREELAASPRDPSFAVPHATMNLGRLVAGDAPNKICAHAELLLDVRFLPDTDAAALSGAIERAAADGIADTGLALSIETGPLFDVVPPFTGPKDAELVRLLEDLTGTRAASVAFGTEAPFFSALATETVVCGPGRIEVAHAPDEHVPLAELDLAVDLFTRLAAQSCEAS